MPYISPDIPGLIPPPGQTSNFNDPYSLQNLAYGILGFELIAVTLTTAARIYTRVFVSRNQSWDDYFMILTWAACLTFLAFELKAFGYGGGVHQWNVRLVDVLEYARWGYVCVILYPVVMAFLKLSISLQVLRIFVTHRDRHFWAIWMFIATQLGWCIAAFLAVVFECKPVQKEFEPLREGTCPVNDYLLVLVTGVLNLLSDIFIWTYPLVRISQLNLPIRRKLGIATIFMIGLIAIAATILRVVFSVKLLEHPYDWTFVLTQFGLCGSTEIATGMIAANSVCLPIFVADLRKKLNSVRNSIRDQINLIRRPPSVEPKEPFSSNQNAYLKV